MSTDKLAGPAWKAHCTAKLKECDERISVFQQKKTKWTAMSKFDSEEQAEKIRALHLAKAKIAKLEAELNETSK